ncbi:MAG: hypothetical protein KF830_16750 [Planctomycetes bacterium]|nr:hypothetical protein [Planctomycetota bacterium]
MTLPLTCRGIALVAAPLFLCSGSLLAQASVAWTAPTRGVAIALDAADNAFTVDFEQQLGAEIVLTKRDAAGAVAWVASHDQTDPTKWEAATWVATDSQGNAIVTGTLKSGYSNPVNAASIVMKWSPSGQLLWRRVYESDFDGSSTRRCLVDESDNVYVLGVGSGPYGFTTKVKKFDPAGTVLWTYHDATGIGAPLRFRFAPDGDLLLVGRSTVGSFNGFARVRRDGQVAWSLPGIPSLTAGDVAGDVSGNAYVVNGEYVTNGGTVVTKVDAGGATIWQAVQPSRGFFAEVGNDDRLVVCGMASSSGGGTAAFALQPNGQLAWANLDADGPANLMLHAQFGLDASNDAYVAAGTLFEMAVCKVRADGTSAWTRLLPGGYAQAFAFGRSSRDLWVVGGTTARLRMAEEGAWTDLGNGLPAVGGTPRLVGEGVFQQGQTLCLQVLTAPVATIGLMVGGGSAVSAPLFGGVLVPNPDVLLGVVTDPFGRALLLPAIPTAVPSGTGLWLQGWFLDATMPGWFRASNAILATAP